MRVGRQIRPAFQPRTAALELCDVAGESFTVEVVAWSHVTAAEFDDDRALVLGERRGAPGFVIFRTDGKLSSGLDLIECATVACAYEAFLLELNCQVFAALDIAAQSAADEAASQAGVQS